MDLLRAGVQLYELKPGAAKSSLRVRGRFGKRERRDRAPTVDTA